MSAEGGGGGCLVSNLYDFNFFLLPCNKKWIEDRLSGWKIKNTRGIKKQLGDVFRCSRARFFSPHGWKTNHMITAGQVGGGMEWGEGRLFGGEGAGWEGVQLSQLL